MSNIDLDAKFANELNELIDENNIFVDIYALFDLNFSLFLKNSISFLQKSGNKLNIFYQDAQKIIYLKKHKFKQAEELSTVLVYLEKNNIVKVVKFENKEAINLIKNALLITNDYRVRFKFNNVIVRRINKFGFLSQFNSNDTEKTSEIQKLIDCYFCAKKSNKAYKKPTYIPKYGDFVYDEDDKKISLIKFISSGGEGVIYETNTEFVAKIYKLEKNNKLKFDKLNKMIEFNIKLNGICSPKNLLFNKNDEFVGFLMPMAKGVELQKSIFIKPLLKKYFPNLDRADLVKICIKILEKISYLHSKDILVGDINPLNILIDDKLDVYFVDCDSYQIENFPCPVGTINFTAPEIQGVNFTNFLRSKNHENFAIATLLFMIMLPGKPPYSHSGGLTPGKNIEKMHFPYALGEKKTEQAPKGIWRFMWSHLPFKVKKSFFETFNKDGSLFTKRLSANEWLKLFKYYDYLFSKEILQEQDYMSLEIYPIRLKTIYNN